MCLTGEVICNQSWGCACKKGFCYESRRGCVLPEDCKKFKPTERPQDMPLDDDYESLASDYLDA